jgi:hypothetical protein
MKGLTESGVVRGKVKIALINIMVAEESRGEAAVESERDHQLSFQEKPSLNIGGHLDLRMETLVEKDGSPK